MSLVKASGLVMSLMCLFGTSDAELKTNFKRMNPDELTFKPPTPRIIGGKEVDPHEYPFTVGLIINGNAFCGGSLISENYVLTAAHCAIVISTVEVILGAHNYTVNETNQVRTSASEIMVHEDFNYTSYENDIALLKLSTPVELNKYIQTVNLPTMDIPIVNDIVTAIGWGLTHDVDNPTIDDTSDVLRAVNVTAIDLKDCEDMFNDNIYDIAFVTKKNFCTSGYKNRGTCNGDSGGPVVMGRLQVGLTSIGTSQCEMCTPSIFTKIYDFVGWIEEKSDVVVKRK